MVAVSSRKQDRRQPHHFHQNLRKGQVKHELLKHHQAAEAG
jgi:hypothetical protein